MASPQRKSDVRLSAPNSYTERQLWMAAMSVGDLASSPPFSASYEGESRYYMPRLLRGACAAYVAGQPLTMREAFVAMDANHGKTAAKYAQQAEKEGWLARSADPAGDKRKTVLIPTANLLAWYEEEMARILDDARNLIAAVARECPECKLPQTGAANLTVKTKIDAQNRHLRRIMETLPDAGAGQPTGGSANWRRQLAKPAFVLGRRWGRV